MRTFKLNDEQEKQFNLFQERHINCCKRKDGKFLISPIGGNFSVQFHPTALGDIITIHCTSCGEHEDITDYSTW